MCAMLNAPSSRYCAAALQRLRRVRRSSSSRSEQLCLVGRRATMDRMIPIVILRRSVDEQAAAERIVAVNHPVQPIENAQ